MKLRTVLLASSLAAGLSMLVVGCGGAATPPPEEPSEPAEPAEEEPSAVAPASSDAVKQGRDAIQAGEFERAVTILAKASSDAPKDPQAAFYHGVALEGAEKLKEAEAEYRRAIELSPQLLEARINLSYLLLSLDRPQEALTVAREGLKVDPKNVPLSANLAGALDMLGSEEAVGAYERLLELSPDDADNRFNYAVVLALGEKKDEAKAQIAKIQTSDAALLLDVGDFLGRLEDYPGCITWLNRAAEADKSAKVLVYRARCKFAAGDKKGAEEDLRGAVKLSPNDPMPYLYLGKHLVTVGQKKEGRAALEKAVQLGPDTPFGQTAKKALAEK